MRPETLARPSARASRRGPGAVGSCSGRTGAIEESGGVDVALGPGEVELGPGIVGVGPASVRMADLPGRPRRFSSAALPPAKIEPPLGDGRPGPDDARVAPVDGSGGCFVNLDRSGAAEDRGERDRTRR